MNKENIYPKLTNKDKQKKTDYLSNQIKKLK